MSFDLGLSIATLLLLAASAGDLAMRMVPNRLCVALGLDGLALQASAHAIPLSVLAMTAVFIPAFACWRLGVMGGGDVKLLGAVTLLVRPAAVPTLVLAIALAGGLLGVLYWTMMRSFAPPVTAHPSDLLRRILRIERHRIARGCSLPYAVAIAGGTLFVLARGQAA